MINAKKWCIFSCLVWIVTINAESLLADVTIYPGPAYIGGTGGTGGITSQAMQLNPGITVIAGGTAIAQGTQTYFTGSGNAPSSDNTASFFFTSAGSTPLQSVGTRPSGNPNSATVYSINSLGMMSGYISNSAFTINTAARWDASGNVTALAPLSVSTASAGNSSAFGYTIDDSGVVAGSSTQYGGGSTSLGNRPVFWAAGATSGTAPTALNIYNTGNGNFGTTNNYNSGVVYSINNSGTMVGNDEKYLDSAGAGTGKDIGSFASAWTPAGAITQLADLPGNGTYGGLAAGDNVNANTVYSATAKIINNNGVISGTISKYDNSQSAAAGAGFQGNRPVRWNSVNSTPQLLDGVGTTTNNGVTGYTSGSVNLMNANGDIAGSMNNYDSSGNSLGTLPELWKAANGTGVTKLGLLGTNLKTSLLGQSTGNANSVNIFDWSVGSVSDYSNNGGDSFGTPTNSTTSGGVAVAALWDPSGNITDLNTLIPTVASTSTAPGWVLLTNAFGITDDGWISGVGTYDPGLVNGVQAPNYTRAFLIQDTAVVPEPATTTGLLIGASVLSLRRRRNALAFK